MIEVRDENALEITKSNGNRGQHKHSKQSRKAHEKTVRSEHFRPQQPHYSYVDCTLTGLGKKRQGRRPIGPFPSGWSAVWKLSKTAFAEMRAQATFGGTSLPRSGLLARLQESDLREARIATKDLAKPQID